MDEDWNVLMSFFPADWADLATASGALKGLRKDKSPANLLRTMMLHVACGYSLRETVVRARQAGLARLSDVALMKRLRKCKDWLYALCVCLFRERGMDAGATGGLQFRLFDATHVKEPGKTGSLWRIHYSICVPSLACDFFKVTETTGRGTGDSLRQFPIRSGDYLIVDRGYSKAPGLHYAASRGAFVCVRLNPSSLAMLDRKGRSFDLIGRLRGIVRAGAVEGWPAWVSDGQRDPLPIRVCAVRKSAEAIRLAHKKLKRRASKKGQTLRAETLFLAEYVIVATTFPEADFAPQDVLEWYRIRWQVELVFKRFKQIAELGHLPKHDDDSAKAWVYGKLFVSLLTEKIVRHASSVSPWGYDLVRPQVVQPVA